MAPQNAVTQPSEQVIHKSARIQPELRTASKAAPQQRKAESLVMSV